MIPKVKSNRPDELNTSRYPSTSKAELIVGAIAYTPENSATELQEDGLLAGKVEVEGALSDTGSLHDARHGRLGVAVLEEQLLSDLEELLPTGRGCGGAAIYALGHDRRMLGD